MEKDTIYYMLLCWSHTVASYRALPREWCASHCSSSIHCFFLVVVVAAPVSFNLYFYAMCDAISSLLLLSIPFPFFFFFFCLAQPCWMMCVWNNERTWCALKTCLSNNGRYFFLVLHLLIHHIIMGIIHSCCFNSKHPQPSPVDDLHRITKCILLQPRSTRMAAAPLLLRKRMTKVFIL